MILQYLQYWGVVFYFFSIDCSLIKVPFFFNSGGGGRGGGRGRGRGGDRGGRGGMGRGGGGDRFEPYGRDGFSRGRSDFAERRPMSDRRGLGGDPYAREPYPARERDPYYGRDPYARDPYARDPYSRESGYARDPYPAARDPYTRDPYARDPYARDPYARDPYARDPYPPRDPYPRDTLATARDPYARPPPEYYDGARAETETARALPAR